MERWDNVMLDKRKEKRLYELFMFLLKSNISVMSETNYVQTFIHSRIIFWGKLRLFLQEFHQKYDYIVG
jgi:hypothetical protein